MKRTKILAIILTVLICLSLSGCDLFTADTAELLRPPALSGDIAPISNAIDKSEDGEYTLKYPSSGVYRSAVIQNDINGDGIFEAFAFYSIVEDDTTIMYINALRKKKDKWTSVAKQKIVGAGVDKVEFSDLDNDGIQEILVGWEIYGKSEMQLGVYSLKENALTQRMLQRYNRFICCDLDSNGANEVLVVKLNSVEQHNVAALYTLTDTGIDEKFVIYLDSDVVSISEPVVSTLSTGKPAVYLDEVKGIGAVTEVLFIEKDKLVSPLGDIESNKTMATLRATAYSLSDINDDGIIEIPVQHSIPSAANTGIAEKLYLINWCSYNGEELTCQMTTMMNTNDGYYYTIPAKWRDNIAAFKDIDNNVIELYKYDNDSKTVKEKLIYIKAVKKSDWEDGKYDGLNCKEITNNGITSYICSVSKKAQEDGVTFEAVKQNFKLIEK